MSARYHERVYNIEKILLIQNRQIDQPALREACLYGIPDKFRPLAWRLFLGYLPKEREKWAEVLKKQRDYYKNLVENLVVKPGYSGRDQQPPMPTEPTAADDHPLAQVDRLSGRSEWADYFKDNEVLKQIDNDVRRLRPEIDFFQRETSSSFRVPLDLGHRLESDHLSGSVHEIKFSDKSFISSASSNRRTLSNSSSNSNQSYDQPSNDNNGTVEKHWKVVERILFVYSKVNPGVKYVQGMNEIIGPIYYVFASDQDTEWAEHAEPDTFYCFQNLMSEIKDLFIRTLDRSDCGIDGALTKFHRSFEQFDPQLYEHLANRLCIRAQFYAFRWISLLLSQEFSLPDLISLWDTLFASSDRLECVESICLAMIEKVRAELLIGDFSQNLRLLQNYPALDISQLVVRALELLKAGQFSQSAPSQSQQSPPKSANKLNKFGGAFMRAQMATLTNTCQKMGRLATAAVTQAQNNASSYNGKNAANVNSKEMKSVNGMRK